MSQLNQIQSKIDAVQAKISKCTASDGDLKLEFQNELDALLLEQAKAEFSEYNASTRLTRTGVAITIIQGGKK